MKEIRMLAAIMFTDMVGYTAMMQENETRAKKLRERHREVMEKWTNEHRGQILQYFGDGTLSIFGSTIEAVMCAVEIQKDLQSEPEVPLRIGIHSGDIVYNDEGIFGDGVNVASRIENLALPGSVLISEKINSELVNQEAISARFIGAFRLKNVKVPIKIYAIDDSKLVVPKRDQLEGKITVSDNSIAVLPFVNMSMDKENEYFSDGITEEILNALAKVDGLMVTSRTSSFSLKGKNTDVREIGKILGVKSILEGSVRKQGQRIRVTAQLINAEDGYHKWSETYDRNLEDIFAVQDEIASTISAQLKKTFSIHSASKNLVKIPTDNINAYNLYLKSLFHWNSWIPTEVLKAIKFCEEAIKLSPDFALAYSHLSACYVYLGAVGFMPNESVYPKAKEYALKSLELDGTQANSHISLAMVLYFNDWDWKGSEKCFLKALELNPNSAQAHQYYSMLLTTLGYHKKALKEAELAFQLDPLNAPVSHILAYAYFNNHQIKEAFAQHKITIEIEPGFGDRWNSEAWMHIHTGNYTEGIKLMNEVIRQPENKPQALAGLGYAYAKLGDIDKTKDYLKQLEEIQSNGGNYFMEMAIFYIALNNMDKAFELLDVAIEKKCGGMNFIQGNFWLDIHSDSRFKLILQKMGIPTE